MSDLARTDDLFFTRAGLDRGRRRRHRRRCPEGRRRRRAVPRVQPVGEFLAFDDGRLKSASFDSSAGLRPARRRRRDDRLRPRQRTQRSGDQARGRDGESGPCRPRRQADVGPQAPTGALHASQPARRGALRTKVKLLPRSTPMPARGRAGAPGDRLAVRRAGRRWRSSAPTAGWSRDVRPLVRLNVSIVVGDGDRRESGPTASAAGPATSVYLEPESVAGRRSTRRCARRW